MNTTTQHTTKYKNSPLGLIPQDWEVKKIYEIGDVSSGGTPDTNNNEFWNGEINWCTPTDITRLKSRYLGNTIKKISEKGLQNSSAKILPVNSIIVCTRATIGKAAINLFPMSTNQGFKNIVPKNVNTEFLYYKIISVENGLLKIASGSTFLEVSKTDFDNFQISLPPLPEQKAIADCLSTWDKAIEKQNGLIAQKELAKKALMQQLLSGKKRLKGFSGEWKEYKISEFGKIETGNTPSMTTPEYYGSEYCWATAYDFKSVYIFDTKIKLSDEGVKVARLVPKGSVLITCIASIGKNAIAGMDLAFNQQINSITPNNSFNSEFIYYLIENSNHKLIEVAGAGAVPIINKTSFRNIKLIAPQIEEQTAIANVLQCADAEIQLLKNKLAQLKEQKKGLMQVLLTGKKRLKY